MILDHRGNVIRQSPSALMETAIRETQLCLVKNNTIVRASPISSWSCTMPIIADNSFVTKERSASRYAAGSDEVQEL